MDRKYRNLRRQVLLGDINAVGKYLHMGKRAKGKKFIPLQPCIVLRTRFNYKGDRAFQEIEVLTQFNAIIPAIARVDEQRDGIISSVAHPLYSTDIACNPTWISNPIGHPNYVAYRRQI